MHIVFEKLKESALSILPVTAVILLINATPLLRLSGKELLVFSICAIFLVIGMTLFNLGADMAMTPMGENVGRGLTHSGKITVLFVVCFVLGVFITVAEPDLAVLASQVSGVMNGTVLVAAVGVGVGLFLVIALLKIVFNMPFAHLLTFCYFLMFGVAAFLAEKGNGVFMPMAFDSGGVTTGPVTVPFIMALGLGVAATLGGKNERENSFGLIALCSVGPILAVLFLSLSASGELHYEIPADYAFSSRGEMVELLGSTMKEVAVALGLIVLFFLLLQLRYLRLRKTKLKEIAIGLIYTFAGLVVFLTAVKIGFMPVGYKMGMQLAENKPALLIFGFILGVVVILAEPAVHVLNHQVEQVTQGAVSRRSMLIALASGVGCAIALSMFRIIFDFHILYIILPGYALSLVLSFCVSGLYTAIAFDSGGVASGPLTSGFTLPFAIGACVALQGVENVMADAFGVVALVAMTPLITIQFLGFKSVMTKAYQRRIAMRRILEGADDQIITFGEY